MVFYDFICRFLWIDLYEKEEKFHSLRKLAAVDLPFLPLLHYIEDLIFIAGHYCRCELSTMSRGHSDQRFPHTTDEEAEQVWCVRSSILMAKDEIDLAIDIIYYFLPKKS
jgi:uncharacterized protein YceK